MLRTVIETVPWLGRFLGDVGQFQKFIRSRSRLVHQYRELKSILDAADRYMSFCCRYFPLCLHIPPQDLVAICSILAALVFSSTILLLPEKHVVRLKDGNNQE